MTDTAPIASTVFRKAMRMCGGPMRCRRFIANPGPHAHS
jgi:hypothetical protein